MFKVVSKEALSENIKRIDISAPEIARRAHVGQFVVVTPVAGGMRVPLAIIEQDARRGIITVIFQETNLPTQQLGALQIAEPIYSILGPLGNAANISKVGTVVCVGYGIGMAQILPLARAFKRIGNKVIGIMGTESKKVLRLESLIRMCCQTVYMSTHEPKNIREKKGSIPGLLEDLLKRETVHLVYVIAPVDLTEEIVRITQEKKIKTLMRVTLPVFEGMGLTGVDRMKIEDKFVLASIEGPEFDAVKVDFTQMRLRLNPQIPSGREFKASGLSEPKAGVNFWSYLQKARKIIIGQ